MKVLVVMFLLTVFVTVMSAPPLQDHKSVELESGKFEIDSENKVYIRHRRRICDLLENSGNVPCAAYCIALGHTGGTCSQGVCVCRRDKIVDLL